MQAEFINRPTEQQKVIDLPPNLKYLKVPEIHKKVFHAIRPEQIIDKNILILCDDATRDTPINQFFPDFLKTLIEKGAKDISIVFAVGTHDKMNSEQWSKKLGLSQKELRQLKIRVSNHDPDHNLVNVAPNINFNEFPQPATQSKKINAKHPLKINRAVIKADTIISINNCLPQGVVGFSGGGKMYLPGIGNRSLIKAFHILRNRLKLSDIEGKIKNPMRRLLDQITDAIEKKFDKKNFIAITPVSTAEGVIDIFTDSIKQSYYRAAKLSREIYVRDVEEKLETILTRIGDNKSDIWQAVQAIYNTAGVIKDGGSIVVSGKLAKGFSTENAKKVLEYGGYSDPNTIYRHVKKYNNNHTIPADDTVVSHMIRVGRVLERGITIYLSSDNVTQEECEKYGLKYIPPSELGSLKPDLEVNHATDILLQYKSPQTS